MKPIRRLDKFRHYKNNKARLWLFRCDYCASLFEHRLDQGLKNKSCGCIGRKGIFAGGYSHGLCGHPLYRVLASMIDRCVNPNNKFYHNYGGRGITVIDKWRNDKASFINWAISNGWKKGLQIDRKNNDGNYHPRNCRFVTHQVNNQNTSRTKLTIQIARRIKVLLKNKTPTEVARYLNVDRQMVYFIKHGRKWTNA